MTSNRKGPNTGEVMNLKVKKPKVPTVPGKWWGKWRIANEDTLDTEDYTPSDKWQVMDVFEDNLDNEGPVLMVWVPQVTTPQAIENFFWGDHIPSPK